VTLPGCLSGPLGKHLQARLILNVCHFSPQMNSVPSEFAN
jgi:hypothetical protein